MKYDNILKLLDYHIQKYQKVLDKQEPFSQSELIGNCNNRINELNKISRQVEILGLLEEFTEAQIKVFLNVFNADPDSIEFIRGILLPEEVEK